MHEHAHVDVLDVHGPLKGSTAKRRRRYRGAAVPAVASVGRPGAVRPRRPGAQELSDVHEGREAGRLHVTLVDLRHREGRGLRFEQDQPVGVGDEVDVEEPRQVPGGLLHQLVEIGVASGAEEVDGPDHGVRALERLQRLVELVVPFFETTTVGDCRRHAVRVCIHARRRSSARLRFQQLAQASAPGGGRPVAAGRGPMGEAPSAAAGGPRRSRFPPGGRTGDACQSGSAGGSRAVWCRRRLSDCSRTTCGRRASTGTPGARARSSGASASGGEETGGGSNGRTGSGDRWRTPDHRRRGAPSLRPASWGIRRTRSCRRRWAGGATLRPPGWRRRRGPGNCGSSRLRCGTAGRETSRGRREPR